MKIFINIIGIVIICYIIEYVFTILFDHKKYKNIIPNLKCETIYKIKKLPFIKRLSYMLGELNICLKIKNINIISTLTILILSIVSSIIIFILTYNFLHLFLSSVILSSFTFFIPYFVIKYFLYCKRNKIIKMFPNFIISLKNYTDVNNDIIEAFKRVNAEEPLNLYIEKFNISLQKGVKIYDAFETLKKSINIERINQFITLLQFCYMYGGNFGNLLDKFSKIQMKTNLQRESEKQKIFSSKLVLVILIILNMYILLGFVLTNNEYYNILVKTFVGNLILNTNILSYIFIFYMYIKLNSMED
jgi:Flp pilus assembly protein TadB